MEIRLHLFKQLVCLSVLVLLGSANAQDYLRTTINMGFGDMAETKKRAEGGDAVAQVALGDALASRLQAKDALGWYRKAAAQGNAEGECRLGQVLLFSPGSAQNETLTRQNQIEGLRWTFAAATNRNPYAFLNMSKALRQGLGTAVDLVAACAWLHLFSQTTPGSITGRVELNELALKMSTEDSQRARDLAARLITGQWQFPVVRFIPLGDARLKLTGIARVKEPVAFIDGKPFSEGENLKISTKSLTLAVKCLQIGKDSATVLVEGEDTPRVLTMAH